MGTGTPNPLQAGPRRRASLVALVFLAGLAAGACRSSAPPAEPPAVARTVPEGLARAADGEVQWRHEWVRGAVFYEVFVRSFADSDGDGIGDLPGLVAHLDDLNDGDPATGRDLGVDALWLMPVFASPSYHGYDVTDYEAIEPDYGAEDDFERLLAEAHRRGIRVIVDLVLNHTSSEHPWFREAASSPASPRRDWYVWRPDDPGWTQPWGGTNPTWHPLPSSPGGAFYYGIFWGGMPDLNYRNPAVLTEMERIADLWLDRGVDGFRLDATRHLVADGPGALQNDTPETHAVLEAFAAHVRRRHPEAVLVGENWTDTATIATYFGSTERIAGGDELPMSFDFPLAEAILEAVKGGVAEPVATTLAEVERLYPPGVIDAPFLTNHDQVRLATQLGGDPVRLRLAASILLTLPGAPFLYYGEEIGLPNGPGGGDDRLKRTPMPWNGEEPGHGFTRGKPWFPFVVAGPEVSVAAQRDVPGSLLARYRELIRLRHASEALGKGEIEVLDTGEPALLAYLRRAGDETVLVAHELGASPVAATLTVPGTVLLTESPEPLLADPGAKLRARDGALEIALPPGATGIWRLQ